MQEETGCRTPRAGVELFADMLARRSEAARLPNEFWPHHGSLAKDVREVVEAQLKDRTRPATAICTSTLEMGIDIGSVASVAQIGPPPSVAALRQRLGRSGRRGEAAVLRIYIKEPELEVHSSPIEQLRTRLVQSVAMTHLLLERWVEPPDDPGLNLSTLVQQTLSLIAQHGGVTPVEAHRALCGPGPFAQVNVRRYAALLRAMASTDLIVQASDGTLLHGPTGERAVNHYSFHTAFQTAEEWRLVAEGRTLGSLPITQPLVVGGMLIFAGRRWRITGVDSTAKVVELSRAAGGVPPSFGGGGAPVSDRVRSEMVAVYEGNEMPVYLDRIGQELLAEARAAWARLDLSTRTILSWGTETLVLPWIGDAALGTLAVALRLAGLDADIEGATLLLPNATLERTQDAFRTLSEMDPPDAVDLARRVENREIDKWDWVLDEDLSAAAYAARARWTSTAPGAWSGASRPPFPRTSRPLRHRPARSHRHLGRRGGRVRKPLGVPPARARAGSSVWSTSRPPASALVSAIA